MVDTQNEKDPKEEQSSIDEPLFFPGDPKNTYLPPLPNEGDEEALDEQKTPFRRVGDRYSYSAVKLYVTQFAMGIFGASVSLATAQNINGLFLAASIFSTLFFVILLHMTVWNIGSSDRISVDGGRRKRNLFTGALIGIAAGIPNFLLAILYTVTYFCGAHSVAAVTKIIMMFSEGMYWSFLRYFKIDGLELDCYWWIYFVIAFVTVFFITISYILGYFNVGLPKFLAAKGEEAERTAKEKKKSQKPTLKK